MPAPTSARRSRRRRPVDHRSVRDSRPSSLSVNIPDRRDPMQSGCHWNRWHRERRPRVQCRSTDPFEKNRDRGHRPPVGPTLLADNSSNYLQTDRAMSVHPLGVSNRSPRLKSSGRQNHHSNRIQRNSPISPRSPHQNDLSRKWGHPSIQFERTE